MIVPLLVFSLPLSSCTVCRLSTLQTDVPSLPYSPNKVPPPCSPLIGWHATGLLLGRGEGDLAHRPPSQSR